MRIDALDHLVLTVRDLEATCAFYARVLGMEILPTPGSGDFCLLTTEPLDAVVAHVRSCGVEIAVGPVERAGARGRLRSIYLRDPDGNLIEVANEVHSFSQQT